MKFFNEILLYGIIFVLIAVIIFLIIIFTKFSIKNEEVTIRKFFEDLKRDCAECFKNPGLLVLILILFIFCILVFDLKLANGKINYLISIAILLSTIILFIGIIYFEIFAQIIRAVISNFTNYEKLRKKALIGTFYPILNIFIIKLYFYCNNSKFILSDFISSYVNIKIIISIIRTIIIIFSIFFIPANFILNIYKGIEECMINAQYVFKDDINRNIKKIKISIAITWFFIILINLTNIVYCTSNLSLGIFKDTTIQQVNNSSQLQGMRISTAAYFSLITVLTIGYGDIIPIGLSGRIITSIISVIGAAYSLIALGSILSDDNSDGIASKIFKSLENKKITIKKDEKNSKGD